MSFPELSVPVRDLDAAGRSFRFPLRASWIRGAVGGTDVKAADREGLLEVRLSRSGNDVVLRGTLTAELIVPCARCLEPARVPVREELSALFVPASALSARHPAGRASARRGGDEEEVAGATEGPDVVPYDGETVVMDDLVRDEMLLALPIVPLCSEACAGIRLDASAAHPDAGPAGSQGVDPRLLPLLTFKPKT